MPYGRFTYVVQFHRIVAPTALWVIHNVGYERLVLSSVGRKTISPTTQTDSAYRSR